MQNGVVAELIFSHEQKALACERLKRLDTSEISDKLPVKSLETGSTSDL